MDLLNFTVTAVMRMIPQSQAALQSWAMFLLR